ncbi:unnamed protein product [Adineta steineri]|uniref:EGF-like domain-containing protein n=1 Tax=Adineta steineri TaxID=433720 RepID=A0A818Q5Z8_9BILA|nr:unnamed protein product [Adineta steineri]
MLIRSMFLLLVLITTISTNSFYENWKNKLKKLKTETKDKVTGKIQEKSQCPIAWQYFAASCYWKFPIKRSWSEARKECAKFRADLVVIDSDNEFDYIAKNVTDLREDFYVGFHYFNESWSWINGRALSEYTYYTEEDLCEDRLPVEPRHRSCGILDRARRGRLCMNVDVCDRKLNFICEKVVDRCSSLNDICGKHGRCVNTDDGQFRCECHFLFSGNRCRSMSQEGSQVIMAAIFVITACIAPILFRSIYRMLKRRLDRTSPTYGKLHCINNSDYGLPKHKIQHQKKQEKNLDGFFKLISNIPYSNICNSSTFIIIFSTFLITTFCLSTIPFVEYRLSLSSISNNSNITLTQKLNSTFHRLYQCRQFDNYVWQNFVSLPLAILVTLICSCLKKRDTFCLQFCHGRPSLPMPFNLFDKRQRHVVAAIFGISANEVLKILEELLVRLNTKHIANDEGIIIELLKRIGIVLLIGMRYFPLLVSVNIPHPIAYGLGLIYTFIDGTYTLIYTSYCSRFSLFRFGRTLLLQTTSNELTQSDLFYVIFRNLPHFTLMSFVFVKFLYLLTQQLKCQCCQQSTMISNHNKNEKNHQVSLVSSTLSIDLLKPDYQTKPDFYYTEGLLKSKDPSDMYYNNVLTRPFAKIYRWHRYFTFSTQILCTYTVVLIVIYNLTCLLTFYGINSVKSQLDRIHILVLHQLNWDIDWGTSFVNDLFFCSFLSVIIYCSQIFNGLIKIQQHMTSAYAGKYIDIPPRHNFSNNELMSKCLHFSGYLCGYTAWGFIIFYKISFIICLLLRLWIRYDSRWFQHILALCLPIVLIYLLKHILISLLSEFVFLQNFGRTPSLNNRRIFFIFNYFNFFFDCFLGILSCLIRVSKAVLASFLFMGRLDYSFMGRNLERLDQGYATYVTFIHMEIIHGHPILVTFCDIIWHDIERKRRTTQYTKGNKLIYDSIMHTKARLARFKWHLFYTLIRNEYLKFLRKHALSSTKNGTNFMSSTTTAAVVLTTNTIDEKQINNEQQQQHSSILLYDCPIMKQPPIPPKRSGYRYNFDYEQTSDLRLIYQQLKCLTNNVAQLKNNNNRQGEENEDIYLSPNRPSTKKQSQVTCTFPDEYSSNSKFHNMPTIQRR